MFRSSGLSGAILLLVAVGFVSPAPGDAMVVGSYQEDFTTTTYKDTLHTTAWWDTTAGELKLHPFSPTIVGSVDTPGSALGVAVSGDVAYVADRSSGLQVVDVSDPANPTIIGNFHYGDDLVLGVAVAGDVAYIADSHHGLCVVDVSDPTNPTFIAISGPGEATGVAVAGDAAYVPDGAFGLWVVDVSDPTNPTIIGSRETPGAANGVAVAGDVAYVADGDAGLQVIDVSDPTNPTIIGSVDTPDHALAIAVAGDVAYVADTASGLQVVDVSDPANPAIITSLDTPGSALGVAVSGDEVYVADSGSGLQMVDVSDPANPTIIGCLDTPDEAYGVAACGDVAFVADLQSGLQVMKVRARVDPTLIGNRDTPGQAYGVAVAGDVVYVADWDAGLQVIDVSDPTNPTIIGSVDTPDHALAIAVAGDVAYVADTASGLQVVDVSDPANPTIIGSLDTPGVARGVAVCGDVAYVADWRSGLQVVDVSDPTNPTIIGNFCYVDGLALGVAVAGDVAYIADNYHGLCVVDVSDPTNPTFIANSPPSEVAGLAVAGDAAYVPDGAGVLWVVDVSDPTNPTLIGSRETPGAASGVAVAGDVAYVADWDAGLQVIDVSDPTNPTIIGSVDTPGEAVKVAMSGEVAYVADLDAGLQVIQATQHEFDPDRNIGWSLAVDGSGETIPRARVTTTQTETVTWELSSDGGITWGGFLPGGSWDRFATPGSDLMWQSTHAWAAPGVNPTVTDLVIDWLHEYAPIDSIVDIPGDQGGRVSLTFTRSGYDFLDETVVPIVGYAIYRRVDDPLLAEWVLAGEIVPEAERPDGPPLASYGADRVRLLGDRWFVLGGALSEGGGEARAGEFPPGVWEGVGWVLPTQSDEYVARVHTLADSTAGGIAWSVYFTATHTSTPSVWFASEPDSGYSVDNIPPSPPTGLVLVGTDLSWDPAPEPDFEYHSVYGSASAMFDSTAVLLGYTVDVTFDVSATPHPYYHVTTSDLAGNESEAATVADATSVVNTSTPVIAYRLYPGWPNPFQNGTTIRLDIPAAGGVQLDIYDVTGRSVRKLVSTELAEGRHRIQWDGRDDAGRQLPSGVYSYRVEVGEFEASRRLVMMR